jgi:hypothetical protein
MQKATNDSTHFCERSGSFSTHGSRRGVNMLGWDLGVEEQMTPKQERAALIASNQRFLHMLPHTPLTAAERKDIKEKVSASNLRLSELRPLRKTAHREFVSAFVLDALKEVVPHAMWKSAVDMAYRRMEIHNSKKQTPGAPDAVNHDNN